MANACILYTDKIRTAILGASSFEPLLAPSLLQVADLGLVWRTVPGVDEAHIIADFGGSTAVDFVAVLALSVQESATFQIRLSTVDETGAAGDAYDSGLLTNVYVPLWRHLVHILPTTASGRFLRVDIAQSGADSISAGAWMAGPLWRMAHNYSRGFATSWEDQDVLTVTRGGAEYVSVGASRRRLSCKLEAITQAELETELFEIGTIVKRRFPIAFVSNPESTNLGRDTIIGRIQNPLVFMNRALGLYSWDLELAELV